MREEGIEQHHGHARYRARRIGSSNYRSYALGALLVIYVFEVIDRILLSMVQEQVRLEMGLSDFQLGLLGGPAFVILTSFAQSLLRGLQKAETG